MHKQRFKTGSSVTSWKAGQIIFNDFNTLLEIILFFGHSIPPILTQDSDHVPSFSPMDCNPLHRFRLHSRMHRQQYSRLQSASNRLSSLPPSNIQVWTDGSVSSPFWSRWCWSVCHMIQMQHILFPVLLHWSNCLQLHSWNLCPQARSRLVN